MTLAVGGDCLSDIAVLRAQPGVFGAVASDPTVSRTISALAAEAWYSWVTYLRPRAAARAHGRSARRRVGTFPARPRTAVMLVVAVAVSATIAVVGSADATYRSTDLTAIVPDSTQPFAETAPTSTPTESAPDGLPALDETVQKIRAAAAQDPEYSGVGVDEDAATVIVLRVGGDNGEIRQYYQQFVQDESIELDILPALLTEYDAQILDALVADALPRLEDQGIHVVYYGFDPRRAFMIGFTSPSDPGIEEVIEEFSIFGEGTVVADFSLAYEPASRLDDFPPYWAGARTQSAGTSEQCTSGFGAYSNSNGADYILTADHCVHWPDPRFFDGGDDYMGRATDTDFDIDTAYIKVSADNTMYDGGVGIGEFSKSVIGWGQPYFGLSICTSGSFSGARCSAITQSQITIGGHLLWYAGRNDGFSIAATGDSGGPVFSGPTGTTIIARGVISGTNPSQPAPCTGVATMGCSSGVYFGDITTAAYRHNLSFTLP